MNNDGRLIQSLRVMQLSNNLDQFNVWLMTKKEILIFTFHGQTAETLQKHLHTATL